MIRLARRDKPDLAGLMERLALRKHARGAYQTILEQQLLAADAREEDAQVLANFAAYESALRAERMG